MNKELREAVATELGFQIGRHVEADVRANQLTGEELTILADAAISIIRPAVLEEAAKVAEGNGLRQYTGKPLIDEIASAIRAMAKEGE